MEERIYFGRILELEKTSKHLDNLDRKIIYALSANARAPLSLIAKEVHASRDIVHYRIKKLLAENIILRFAPSIDLSFFGFHSFSVFFILSNLNKERRNNFMHQLLNHPNTKSVMEYSTKWEVEWVVVAQSLQEFDEILTKISTEFADVIIEKNSAEIIKGFKSITLPQRPEYEYHQLKKKQAKYVPDKTDLNILEMLCDNCRLSSYDIAARLGISSNTVRYRIKQLVSAGVIRRFSVLVDLNALDYHLYSIGVVVKSLNERNERKLAEFVRGHRFIIRAVKVLGHWDLMFAIVADTIKNFHKTVKEITDEFADIIVNYESLIAYKEHTFKFFPKVVVETQKP